MRIHTVGDGIFDDAVKDVEGQPCVLLVADSREEIAVVLRDVRFRDDVTIVRAPADREFHALRAKVLGIDPFSNPIGALQRLQEDLSKPVDAAPTPSVGQTAKGQEK